MLELDRLLKDAGTEAGVEGCDLLYIRDVAMQSCGNLRRDAGASEMGLARHPPRDDSQVWPRTEEVRPSLTVAFERSEQIQHASKGSLPVDAGRVVIEHKDVRR